MKDPKETAAPTDAEPTEIATDELDKMSGSGPLPKLANGADVT